MSNMPEDLRARLAEINPTWGKDILGNVATTLALYTPLLAAAPKDGVRIEREQLAPTSASARNTTPNNTGGGTTFNPFWDRAFIQFAGFTVGRSQSFFDLFTYGGAYSSHNVRVSGDTGASGQNLWAYTAQFGNGSPARCHWKTPPPARQGHLV